MESRRPSPLPVELHPRLSPPSHPRAALPLSPWSHTLVCLNRRTFAPPFLSPCGVTPPFVSPTKLRSLCFWLLLVIGQRGESEVRWSQWRAPCSPRAEADENAMEGAMGISAETRWRELFRRHRFPFPLTSAHRCFCHPRPRRLSPVESRRPSPLPVELHPHLSPPSHPCAALPLSPWSHTLVCFNRRTLAPLFLSPCGVTPPFISPTKLRSLCFWLLLVIGQRGESEVRWSQWRVPCSPRAEANEDALERVMGISAEMRWRELRGSQSMVSVHWRQKLLPRSGRSGEGSFSAAVGERRRRRGKGETEAERSRKEKYEFLVFGQITL